MAIERDWDGSINLTGIHGIIAMPVFAAIWILMMVLGIVWIMLRVVFELFKLIVEFIVWVMQVPHDFAISMIRKIKR